MDLIIHWASRLNFFHKIISIVFDQFHVLFLNNKLTDVDQSKYEYSPRWSLIVVPWWSRVGESKRVLFWEAGYSIGKGLLNSGSFPQMWVVIFLFARLNRQFTFISMPKSFQTQFQSQASSKSPQGCNDVKVIWAIEINRRLFKRYHPNLSKG